MHRLWQGVKRVTVEALSLDRVGKPYHVLTLNYVFLMLYATLEGTFVNTLLYTITPDMSIVIFYRAITYIASAFAMQLAAFLGQKKSPLFVIRTGGGIYLAMYLVLFFGLDHMELLLIPCAILAGGGGAFYWVGHNMIVPSYTTRDNREIGIAILGIVQGVMTLLTPVASGFVISWMPGSSGYRVMFGVGMAAVAAQLLVLARLYPVEQTQHSSQLKLAVQMLRQSASIKLMMGYEYIRGVRDGAFGFIMNMVLFEIITDESLVGINTFLSGIASIAGAWVYGHAVRAGTRGNATVAAAILLAGLAIPLFWVMNAPAVMLFNVATSFGSLFMFYSCNNQSYDVLGQNRTIRKCMAELLGFRELAIEAGRLSGLAILMVLPHTSFGYVQAIVILTAVQVFCGGMIRVVGKMVDRVQESEPSPLPEKAL